MKTVLSTTGLLLMVALVACSSTPPNYYVLSSINNDPNGQSAESARRSVGVEIVALPGYLDNTRLMRRTGNNTLSVHPDDQWSEPLDEGVQRVLTENLARLLPNAQVRQFPWPRAFRPDQRLTVRIAQFDVSADGSVLLSGDWVLEGGSERPAHERRFHFRMPAQGDSHADVAGLMSEALAELTKSIAREIR